ncbi:hypothetical protein CY34DRAFT_812481 [Suillus luteus UH-Slu-Lm8-n1]|uniref:Uncharacterized protein n=1 Tax=Suillus luteus UH-Slu-Lm8-n1 TaxID=930992 RepID=A0A0D0AAB3_9AGAM|nr:hypothetical protein CY34DRAFT_812481 [Suillus luteus UH-Slu-Lm8-n1]
MFIAAAPSAYEDGLRSTKILAGAKMEGHEQDRLCCVWRSRSLLPIASRNPTDMEQPITLADL